MVLERAEEKWQLEVVGVESEGEGFFPGNIIGGIGEVQTLTIQTPKKIQIPTFLSVINKQNI